MTYITIFDSKYLSRAILCVSSLLKYEPNAIIYLFCLDDISYDTLKDEDIPRCIAISPDAYENTKLKSLKALRTWGEYAWTLKPFAIEYIFDNYHVDNCAYIDADLYFLAPARQIADNHRSASVILTPHNFSCKNDTSETNGYYCAQYIFFRNDNFGRELLLWWKDQCALWCFNRHQNGLFGDQKYLETIAKHGATSSDITNVFAAPWNVKRYSFMNNINSVHAIDMEATQSGIVVFFHFHGLKLLRGNVVDLGGYAIPKNSKRIFYKSYVSELRKANEYLMERYKTKSIDYDGIDIRPIPAMRAIRNWVKGRYTFVKTK